jgi:hypothetical protein
MESPYLCVNVHTLSGLETYGKINWLLHLQFPAFACAGLVHMQTLHLS